MNSIIRLIALVAGLVLLLTSSPSWGGPPNPTDSDPDGNTAGGTNALINLVPGPALGRNNTAFGQNALQFNTTGSNNTVSGANALQNNTTGFHNTASGVSVLQSNTTGANNTATGFETLKSNTTGSGNTASGLAALRTNTTGGGNTATGFETLFGNTTGGFNTASGFAALITNTTGDHNTATGAQALRVNSTGTDNAAHGYQALFSNTTGIQNTASGVSALESNNTGNNNTASGGLALQNNTDGSNNTAVGFKALKKSLGTKNIGLGYQAGVTLTNGSNNIFIGNQGAGDESQTIRIGTAQTRTFIAGIAGVNVSNAEVVAVDATTGQLGIVQLSSARYKQDIAPMGVRSEGLHQLRPVTFAYRDDVQATMHYGLVAEEVAAVYPQLVTYAPTGEVRTVRYQELIPMLLNELQREHQEVATLRKELAELRALVGQGREMAASSR